MDKDFNLDKVGKRMPYTTPEGFLDQLEANVWQEVKADMNMHQTKPRRKLYRLSIVSTLLAAAAFYFKKFLCYNAVRCIKTMCS